MEWAVLICKILKNFKHFEPKFTEKWIDSPRMLFDHFNILVYDWFEIDLTFSAA